MGRGHTRGVSVALHLLQCLYHLHKTEYFSSVIGRNHLEAIQMGCTGFDKDGYCQKEGTHFRCYNNDNILPYFQPIRCRYLSSTVI